MNDGRIRSTRGMEFQVHRRKIGCGRDRYCAGIQLDQEFSALPCSHNRAADLPIICQSNQASSEMNVFGLEGCFVQQCVGASKLRLQRELVAPPEHGVLNIYS